MNKRKLRFKLTKEQYDRNLFLTLEFIKKKGLTRELEFIKKKGLTREYVKYACDDVKKVIKDLLIVKRK